MSVEVDLNQFVTGGYFITKPMARPDFLSVSPGPEMPERFISLSHCFADFLPGTWVWEDWDKRIDRAKEVGKWGIDSGRTTEVIGWVRSRYVSGEMGWIYVFCTLDTPRDFLRHFDVPLDDLVLVGIGLHRRDVSRLMKSRPKRESAPGGEYLLISKGLDLAPGGTLRGFEPLVLGSGGSFHTWLCNNLPELAFAKKGIRPNAHGFLDRLEDARWVADYVNEDPYQRGEPGLWLPWLVMTYPIK
jgi:hypothetical protein